MPSLALRTTAFALALLPILAGCDLVTDPHGGLLDDVRENRALWESQRPVHYVYVLEHECFCGAEARGPVVVEVDGGTVVRRVYEDSGEPVAPGLHATFHTVDRLFDILQDAAESSADQIDASFDPTLGVPTDFFIDYSEKIADEEEGYRVRSLPSEVTGG